MLPKMKRVASATSQYGDEIEQVLRLRVQERQAALASLNDTARVYQSGLPAAVRSHY